MTQTQLLSCVIFQRLKNVHDELCLTEDATDDNNKQKFKPVYADDQINAFIVEFLHYVLFDNILHFRM